MILWTTGRTLAFGVVRRYNHVQYNQPTAAGRKTVRWMATITDTKELCGIEFVQQTVVDALNDIFDPKEVARGNARAKLDKKGSKKNQKKSKPADDTMTESNEPAISEEAKEAIVDAAAALAKPFGMADAMVTPATRPEFGDYQVNAAMGLAKALNMSPR